MRLQFLLLGLLSIASPRGADGASRGRKLSRTYENYGSAQVRGGKLAFSRVVIDYFSEYWRMGCFGTLDYSFNL
jgi:hypothetical protein